MTPEEAKARVAAENADLAGMEADVSRLATMHPGPVVLTIMRALVEMVCASQGPHFAVLHKRRFYRGVLEMLRSNGIT